MGVHRTGPSLVSHNVGGGAWWMVGCSWRGRGVWCMSIVWVGDFQSVEAGEGLTESCSQFKDTVLMLRHLIPSVQNWLNRKAQTQILVGQMWIPAATVETHALVLEATHRYGSCCYVKNSFLFVFWFVLFSFFCVCVFCFWGGLEAIHNVELLLQWGVLLHVDWRRCLCLSSTFLHIPQINESWCVSVSAFGQHLEEIWKTEWRCVSISALSQHLEEIVKTKWRVVVFPCTPVWSSRGWRRGKQAGG